MHKSLSRRTLLSSASIAAGISLVPKSTGAAMRPPSLPIGWPDQPAGAGFRIGHGFQCENTWYLPGYWHTAEDWYAIGRDTAGARVYALRAGRVVFVGSDYPGRVVIIRHADGLYSMYGHLSYNVPVSTGEDVNTGQILGTVLYRGDGRAPSHLHYEVRTFLYTADVNGPNPRYGFGCGPNCAPGPGYWPKSAPDLPVDQGWRNPTHVYGSMLSEWVQSGAGQVQINIPDGLSVPVWNAPPSQSGRSVVTSMTLEDGEEPAILAIEPGPIAPRKTSAESYDLWYQIEDDWGGPWIPMLTRSYAETGSDGRPSSITFNFNVTTT